jgi:hypothetical protein
MFSTTRSLSINGESLTIGFVPVAMDYTQNAKELLPDPFTVAVTTSTVALAATRQLNVTPAAYGPTFSTTNLTVDRKLPIALGSYGILAQSTNLHIDRNLRVYPSGNTYVESGYVEQGYVGQSNTYSLDTNYVTEGYVQPGYVGSGISGQMVASRQLSVNSETGLIDFATVDFVLGGNFVLSELAIQAIAEAVWARQLPLGNPPDVESYGTRGLSLAELNAISHAVWSKTL